MIIYDNNDNNDYVKKETVTTQIVNLYFLEELILKLVIVIRLKML